MAARIEPGDCCFHITDTATDATRCDAYQVSNGFAVVSLAKRFVEIDHCDLTDTAVKTGKRPWITGIPGLSPCHNQLNSVAVLKVESRE